MSRAVSGAMDALDPEPIAAGGGGGGMRRPFWGGVRSGARGARGEVRTKKGRVGDGLGLLGEDEMRGSMVLTCLCIW